MLLIKKVAVAALLGSLLLPLGQTWANDSVSLRKLVLVAGIRYWQAVATCDGSEDEYKLRRREGKDNWCAMEFDEICDPDKTTTAKKICAHVRGDEALADNTAEDAEKNEARTALINEQIDIERKLIVLRQRGLELQKRELELKREQVQY
ncbi:hypothetical protein [Arenicella chitinivorans]|nr:hypothetical protein [Arenicella chitinivorans]